MESARAQGQASRPLAMSADTKAPVPAASIGLPATPFLRLYARWRQHSMASLDPVAAQRHQLLKLVRAAARTRFGTDHDFPNIAGVADYQARVPVRTYGQLWESYWKASFPVLTDCTWPGQIPYFAVSSGTSTGKIKHIPCSREMVRANKRSALDVLVHHLLNRPSSRVFNGKCFLLGGSTDLTEEAPGIFSGDISGIAGRETPGWVRPFYFPPRSLRFISDWEEKIRRIGTLALEQDIRFISGAPGWLLILFEKLLAQRPQAQGRLAGLFPNLELVTHGGVSFAPYRKQFEALLDGSRAELREVYPASEGFIAIADRGANEGLRLILDNGLFFEFIPTAELGTANPTRHWIGSVETGVDYAIVLTTCAGLWSYMIGDVVRFVDLAPTRILITGRTSYMLTAFGEHLTGELVETCVLKAAEEIGATVSEFSVGTEFSEVRGKLGRHVYVVEFVEPVMEAERVAAFTAAIDRLLAERNEDYCERRVIASGVQAPVVHTVSPGTFAAWMKSRGKLGGQHKVPRVINDADLLANLLHFIGGATN